MVPTQKPDVQCEADPHVSAMTATSKRSSTIFHRRITWLGAAMIVATLFIVYFHVVRFQHAGGLWRDEANSIQTATAPTWERFWDIWRFDSFPMTWFGVLRAWCHLPGGDTDTGLRLLGLLTGLTIVGALWLNAHWMGYRLPIFSITLVALNPIVIVYGDSVRAYGFGIVLEVLLFGLLWRLSQRVTRGRFLAATIVAVLTVHCLYNHSLTLFAMAVGIMTACALRRAWRNAGAVLLVGVISAISVVPLLANVARIDSLWVVAQTGLTPAKAFSVVRETVDAQHAFATWIWSGVSLLAGIVVVTAARRGRTDQLFIVACVAAFVSIVTMLLFLLRAQMPTTPWYYINLLAILGICLDMVFAGALTTPVRRGMAAVFITLVLIASTPAIWSTIHLRMTNIDAMADILRERVLPDDYVIVFPHFLGVSFNRYYEGSAPWESLPPLTDHSVHRIDQIKHQLAQPDAIRPVLDKVQKTLRDGHNVWLVRIAAIWPPNAPPPHLPPAPQSRFGWYSGVYDSMWAAQLDAFIHEQGSTISVMGRPDIGDVYEYEETFLAVAHSK